MSLTIILKVWLTFIKIQSHIVSIKSLVATVTRMRDRRHIKTKFFTKDDFILAYFRIK